MKVNKNNPMTTITCPSCSEEISVGEALFHEIEESVKGQYEKKIKAKEIQLQKETEELAKAKLAVDSQKEQLDKLVAEKLKSERAKVYATAKQEIEALQKESVDSLKEELVDREKKLAEARNAERELRKKAHDVEDRAKNVDLEVARKLDEEKAKILESISMQAAEENKLKIAEKDKQLDDMRKQIEELRRKSEQGSQQLQGEVFEIELEKALAAQFPMDSIEPVAKGVRGGDIIHRVFSPSGTPLGAIVWETKRTKAWTDTWLAKIREDQREVTADFCVIVSQVLPKGVSGMALIDGVWVCDFNTALALGVALRHHINDVGLARSASAGKGEKMENLYQYLTGTRFKQRVEAIVEAFQAMQEDLQKEKTAIQRMWAKREQQISAVIFNTSGMYGEVQGVVGTTMPKIQSLELEELAEK